MVPSPNFFSSWASVVSNDWSFPLLLLIESLFGAAGRLLRGFVKERIPDFRVNLFDSLVYNRGMEFANKDGGKTAVRVATRQDAAEIRRLLQTAVYRHFHVDWYLPGDWIGHPTFVLMPRKLETSANFNKLFGSKSEIEACLAIAADPLPAAWVRVAAFRHREGSLDRLKAMLTFIKPVLATQGVTQIAWLQVDQWPRSLLESLGFAAEDALETFVKTDISLPDMTPNPDVIVREVFEADYAELAEMEALSFGPLWRHSAQGLSLAKGQALSFDVAELNGRLVGFQLSTPSDYGVHLVRLTVHPHFQRLGIGSTLLAHAFAGYHRRNLSQVTLNTQTRNIASKRLYQKFGFQPSGQQFPVWTCSV